MMKPLKRVAVTGGAGQIAYNLLFRIANGDMLGKDQPVALHILELPVAIEGLKGVVMELLDSAFPLLQEVKIGSDPFELFGDIDYALLVGAKPRGPGMERGDLLKENGKIFVNQGQALNASANPNVKVLVVGNPCNTNCLICMNNAPKIPRKNFHAMTRLDQNRAAAQLAIKAHVPVSQVTNVTIWGNHSATQVPDFYHARIKGAAATKVITDRNWLENEFIKIVQQRGAEVIKARGKSSAASAANAAIDAMSSVVFPTVEGQWFSSGVCSDGNSYGIEQDLIFSFPCRADGRGEYEIFNDLLWNDFLIERIKKSEKELLEERDLVMEMMKA